MLNEKIQNLFCSFSFIKAIIISYPKELFFTIP